MFSGLTKRVVAARVNANSGRCALAARCSDSKLRCPSGSCPDRRANSDHIQTICIFPMDSDIG